MLSVSSLCDVGVNAALFCSCMRIGRFTFTLLCRDIKLENIIMDAMCNVKLADFGLAIDQKFEQANTRLVSLLCCAPESDLSGANVVWEAGEMFMLHCLIPSLLPQCTSS